MYQRNVNITNQKGENGFEHIADTNPHTVDADRIFACEATAIATVTNFGTAFTTIALPAGSEIQGHFSSITLTSGSVIAYKRTV